jgi:hypothetical protein
LLKPPKNKTFNYQSDSSKENDVDLDDSKKIDFISKWKRNSERSVKVKGVMPIRTLVIVLVLLLICMYLLDKKFM